MNKVYLLSVVVVLLLTPLQYVSSHSEVSEWIYALTSTDESYYLFRVSIGDGKVEQLLSIPSTPVVTFRDVVPEDELDSLRTYLISIGEANPDIRGILRQKPTAFVQSMSVAPNNQTIALDIIYRYCFNAGTFVCFGTSQVVLVSNTQKAPFVLWNLGFHSVQYAPKGCMIPELLRWAYINVDNIHWTPDQREIIASLSGDVGCFGVYDNWPLVVIPLTGTQPFTVGEARIWAISSDSRTIGAIVRHDQSSVKDSVEIINFDATSRKVSRSNYSLGQYSTVEDRFFGIAFVKGMLVFDAYDSTMLEGGGGLVVFDPSREPHVSISPRLAVAGKGIAASPDNETVIVEGFTDGSLWRVEVKDHSLQAQQIVKGPVESWRWGRNKQILVKMKDDPTFSIIDDQGNTVGKVDVLGKIKAVKGDVKVVAVDW
jgi:hypothetical protein